MTFWTRGNTPYTGPVQDVFIGDTRFGAPKGYPKAGACTNLWTLRAEWEHDPRVLDKPTFFDLEKQRHDQIASAITGTGTGGVADGYDARRKVVDFWWDLGVRGVLLEKPEARPADSTAYQCIVATGKAWLARGGNLYVILEDEAKGVALASEWDSANTWVYVR